MAKFVDQSPIAPQITLTDAPVKSWWLVRIRGTEVITPEDNSKKPFTVVKVDLFDTAVGDAPAAITAFEKLKANKPIIYNFPYINALDRMAFHDPDEQPRDPSGEFYFLQYLGKKQLKNGQSYNDVRVFNLVLQPDEHEQVAESDDPF